MNKTSIKNYAIWARTTLLQAVKQSAFAYEITEAGELDPQLTAIAGRLLSNEERKQRRELIEKIRTDGYEQVMEQTAYIWFNRFIALRFMEVNGYLPSRIRVFTDDNGEFRPAILKEAMNLELEGLNREKVFDYLEKQDNEALYKYLLLTQCNALNKSLPYMFEKIDNYTELLFPNGLLKEGSVIGRMISDIPEEDWTDQVQIIGWLYQYYNSELKDDTFTKLKKNVKISKERIPAATQLFTPDWIVRYMVENSLGRLWLEGHPNDNLKAEWKYYLEEAEQEPEVEAQLAEIRKEYQAMKPEEIRIIDPCMGSGHILVAAFDVLMKIYTSCGWSERDAAKSILENNLYGLDIDDRAGQLAYFSVMMEARKYNRRILNGEVKPNLMAISESGFMSDELIHYVAGEDQTIKESLTYLRSVFKDAKEYGSILTVKELNFAAIYDRLDAIGVEIPDDLIAQLLQQIVVENLRPVIKQAEMLAGKYDVVVTNPPYMGGSGMDAKLSEYVKENYPDSKSDLSTVCMERTITMCQERGYMAMINIPVWMFLSSYEKLRSQILAKNTIINMVHPGRGIFGSDFGAVTFVIAKNYVSGYAGHYRRLFDKQGEVKSVEEREQAFFDGIGSFNARQANFAKIPGSPVAYSMSQKLIDKFDSKRVDTYCTQRMRISTGNNDKFLRLWFEVEKTKLFYPRKWVAFSKGGEYRKWYGNWYYVLNYENNGFELRNFPGFSGGSDEWYFKPGLVWTDLSSAKISFRYFPKGGIACSAGPMISMDSKQICLYMAGYLNSAVSNEYAKILCTTIHFQWGDVAKFPIIYSDKNENNVIEFVKCNIILAKSDWDSYETSWDFKQHPLV